MPRRRQHLVCVVGIVRDRHLQRVDHRHAARRGRLEIVPNAELEQTQLDDVVLLRDADTAAEVADRRRRHAAPAQARDRRHARIVPPGHVPLGDELVQQALAHHRVFEPEPREFDLRRMKVDVDVVEHPVVQRPVIFEFERAQRVRDAFERVADAMRVVVRRIDAPRVAGALMAGVADAVQHRVAHVHVRRRHVDARAQHVRAVGKFAGAHPPEQIEVLRNAAIAIRTVAAGFGQRAARRADLFGTEAADERLAVAARVAPRSRNSCSK